MNHRRLRLAAIILPAVLGTLLCGALGARYNARQALLEDSRVSEQRLNLYANNLNTLIERYRALPAVLALDPEVADALQRPLERSRQLRLNLKLERLNQAAQSSTLELLDRNGIAVAASNWDTSSSYVGHDYSFRPYFQQARTQGAGRFYAVGVTTGVPGYFLSCAVTTPGGEFLGALVVKLEFAQALQQWPQDRDILLISDGRGVAFIASDARWRYRLLRPLDQVDRMALADTRQYHRQPLAPLAWEPLQTLGERHQLARIDGAEYLWESRPLPAEGWTLHVLRPWQPDARGQWLAAVGAGSAWLCAVFALLVGYQRLRLARLRRNAQHELERLVHARTLDLREAQDGLVHSARLAALGQMAATLAHEINQPLTTQRMQLASLRLLLERGRLDEARAAVRPLEQMVERMNALTRHLKDFSRKSPRGLREPLDLAEVLDQALQLLASRVREQKPELVLQVARPARVLGDALRLEQVLINLLGNALDALAGVSDPMLRITLERHGNDWHLAVIDNAGGIPDDALPRVFDAFFTSKPAGQGLGLGLAVSRAIAEEQGGRLSAENREGGACFTLQMPAATEAS
ncbi:MULTISPECIES: ATP-binding protein [unclassified Pseudomonas]|uniref:sensor histidine kinase n=1 Tax=unclassified Pseudomonas TaxID=196821 RepID=UPI000BDCD3F8|nr:MULTISPECIES: ATP-binding protein [unclassified Pseudomonas]PVZ16225.1 two-component system C4-dicarboxylate transport sensor histidine kinase DctB [Pseudomonas sp. URIL14HWK12:I12]PVZ25919.1 two-component system C4-dicarboxylate transport sensor histidine kinase DctB [Pseudomonas sp. URIL14HWK12:I10]PVZ36557.1 two-component system C4-dicarboxylate transport sensor histidine kinase DctB [Pseudomonas sp. URIL14HWK12:I11]SNZ13176.1 two-component system, NtrC family, C4-dicarboxylate transport 